MKQCVGGANDRSMLRFLSVFERVRVRFERLLQRIRYINKYIYLLQK